MQEVLIFQTRAGIYCEETLVRVRLLSSGSNMTPHWIRRNDMTYKRWLNANAADSALQRLRGLFRCSKMTIVRNAASPWRCAGLALLLFLWLERPANTQSQRVNILVPLESRVKITSTDQVLTIPEPAAAGWDIEVYHNGLLSDTAQAGGENDFQIVGCCQIVPTGGLTIGDTYRFRFMVWRQSLVY